MKYPVLIIFFISLSTVVQAQMFSYESNQQARPPSTTYLQIGVPMHTFKYTGANPNLITNSLEFETNGFYLGIESPAFNLSVNLANRLTGLEGQNYTNLALDYNNTLMIVRRSSIRVGLPLQLGTDLVSISSEANREDFNQVALSFNPGVMLDLRLKNKVQLINQVNTGYGFSSSSGGFFGGSVKSLRFKSRLNILNFIKERSISVGYNYILKVYDIEGEDFDYDLSGHTLSIGFTI